MTNLGPAGRTGTPSSVQITTSSTTIALADDSRRWMYITNDSANVVYISVGTRGDLYDGIRLNANGGFFEISEKNSSTGTIYGISSATSSVSLQVC